MYQMQYCTFKSLMNCKRHQMKITILTGTRVLYKSLKRVQIYQKEKDRL